MTCATKISAIFSRAHATLHPALSVGRSVGWLIGRLVGRSVGRWSVNPNFTFLSILFFYIILSHFRVYQVILSRSVSLARDL